MPNNSSETRKKMLVICPFPEGVAAGQRLKYEQYFDDWREKGWDIDVSSFMDMWMWNVVYKKGHYPQKVLGVIRGTRRRIKDLFRMPQYDLIYVFMWVTPFGTSVMERLTRKLASHLVFDVEDNVLIEQNLPKDQNPNPLVKLLKGPWKTRFLITHADHVITSSPFLNDLCMDINAKKSCTYISSSVDTDRFLPATPYSNERPVVIGWTGTFSSKVCLDLLQDVFRELSKRVPYKLKVIGNFEYELPGVDLEVVQWTKEHEITDLQTFDIGVYPLPINDWVLGKSGLKAIQYMAFGLPTVATEVGTTPLLIEHDKNGLLVKTDVEWIEALERLVKDAALRQRIGEAARKSAVKNYSLHAIRKSYSKVLNSVMESEK